MIAKTMQVTIFKNVFDKTTPTSHSTTTSVGADSDGKSSTLVADVSDGDKEKKKELPVVCFSGEFSSRADDALFEHSGFIVLDFDHVDVDQTKTGLATDDFIHSCWTSPSGNGVKALVQITHPERHRDHFRALIKYFERTHGLELDESGINESRACFESHDPDIIIKDEHKVRSLYNRACRGAGSNQRGLRLHRLHEAQPGCAYDSQRSREEREKHRDTCSMRLDCVVVTLALERWSTMRLCASCTVRSASETSSQKTHALNTILDGIENGQDHAYPRHHRRGEERQREMLINDGDMSFMSSDDEDFRWIDDYSQGKIEIGLDTGDPKLDEHFRYKKEFVIVNGHSNVGKTTTALYLIANSSISHGWKWIIYSSENRTASVKMQLMQFSMDKKVADMNYFERKQAYKWVQEHFVVISNNSVYSYSDIIVFMEKIMRQQEVDAIFIDPYNSLKLDMRNRRVSESHDYHYEAASEFLTFSKSNNVAVWLNMHAVTEAQRRKGDDDCLSLRMLKTQRAVESS